MAKRTVGQPRKIPDERWPEIIERHRGGEQIQSLAQEFGVTNTTLRTRMREAEVHYDHHGGSPKIRDVNLRDFASSARSILWCASKSNGKHPLYEAWKARVQEFRERHSCSYGAAVVQASKEVRCLWKLFRKFNVEQFDKYPHSHPEITKYQQQRKAEATVQKVVSKNIEQSYKENLTWAISAAGENQRTGVPLKSCPNDAAFFLYQQALEDPKGFLARFSMAEAKGGDDGASDRVDKERTTAEIDSMLGTILDDTNEGAGD